MQNETMLSTALEAFKTMNKENLTFEQIYQYVREKFIQFWIEQFSQNDNNFSEDEIDELKRGQLYKLLTIDGKFFRLADGRWTINRPIENTNR
ncbi:hypothetical protein ACWXVL_02110 [Mycoplasma sp. 128]|uniref:hypothetical protein n=1 Tax=Mycoplasma sp. 3341 TaxID=3447506 RepID=UPI003F654F00